MKKIILTFIGLLSISVSCMAQTEKGKILLGGYANFNSFKGTGMTNRSTSLRINPTVGIFVTDNVVIGTGLGYVHTGYTQNLVDGGEIGSVRRKAYVVSVSPFGRYYVGITPQFKFFGQLEASANWRNIKASDADAAKGEKDFKSNFYTAALSPGFALFPSKKIGIELSFSGFQFSRDKSIGDFQSFSFGSDFFSPRLGIQFYL